MSEASQLSTVAELAKRYGVLFHHCNNSLHCSGDRGLPDVILVGLGGVCFVELKSGDYRTSRQTTWWWTLKAAGVNVYLWRDSDIRNGAAEEVIASLARTRVGA